MPGLPAGWGKSKEAVERGFQQTALMEENCDRISLEFTSISRGCGDFFLHLTLLTLGSSLLGAMGDEQAGDIEKRRG